MVVHSVYRYDTGCQKVEGDVMVISSFDTGIFCWDVSESLIRVMGGFHTPVLRIQSHYSASDQV